MRTSGTLRDVIKRSQGQCSPCFHSLMAVCLIFLGSTAVALRGAPVQITYDLNGNLQNLAGASVSEAPSIVAPPQYALGQVGGQASFSVVAAGSEPLAYQWSINGLILVGATNDTLSFASLSTNNFGNYTVLISNPTGSVTSAPVALYLDSNRDGIPDSWELEYFGSLNVPAYAVSNLVGVPNIDDFLDGTNPTNNAAQFFTLTVNADVEVEPLMNQYPPGTVVTLTAQTSDDLSFDEWSGGLAGAHNPATLVMTSNTVVTALRGNPGLDPNWTPVFTTDNGGVYALLTQPDGKVLVGGLFSDINGRPIQNLARLNADGSVDTNFLTALELGTSDNSAVSALALQPDGKILVGGAFYAVDYESRYFVARLNSDGSLDQTFNTNGGPNSSVYGIGVLSDGRIVIGGQFSQVSGSNYSELAILSTNGTVDTTFAPTNAFNSSIYSVAIQPGDRIIASGAFTQFGSQPVPYVARVLTNGMLDSTFNPGGSGPNAYVETTRVLPDGNLFCVGGFNMYNTTPGPAAMLDSNGVAQSTFASTAGLNSRVLNFVQDQSGGFILSGSFNYFGSIPAQSLARFTSAGTFDPTFTTTNAANRQIYALALQTNGTLFVGGEFSTWSNTFQDRLIALNATNAVPVPNLHLHAAFRSEVTQTLLQSNGFMMVGGNFVAVDAQAAPHLARLTPTGALDPTFSLSNSPNAAVEAILPEPDGSYYVGGGFGYCGNQFASGLAHFFANGSLDPGFQTGTGFDGGVYSLANQPGFGIIVGGQFTDYQGQFRPGLARLLTSGALDYTFVGAIGGVNSPSGFYGYVYCIALQPDGKILIGGEFATVLGVPSLRVARLLPNGQLDTTFNPGAGMDGTVNAMALQPDGKILIGGNFNYVDNAYLPHIARLLSNGTPDLSFPHNNTGVNGDVWQVALQQDGSMYLAGDFGQVNGITQNRCAHFFADGSVDPSFNPGSDLNDNTYTLATAPDGSIYLGGWVRQVYSQPRVGMVRLVTGPGIHVQFAGTQPGGPNFTPGQAVQLTATATAPAGISGVNFQVSPDGEVFDSLSVGVLSSSSQWTATWQPQTPGTYYLRAVATDNSAQQQASMSYGPLTVGSTQALPGFAAWVAANFSAADQANPAISGEFAIPYNDGVPNWLKFATGTAPTSVPTVTGGVWPIPGSPQYPTLSYRQNLAATTIQFSVQVSTNLVTWSDGSAFTTLVSSTTNGDGTQTVVERSNVAIGSATDQFLRLVATPP
jgi:uncharacterized delta-60 repeat protein